MCITPLLEIEPEKYTPQYVIFVEDETITILNKIFTKLHYFTYGQKVFENEANEIVKLLIQQITMNKVEALNALISFGEFKVREGKFSRMPKGLLIQMTTLNSWLYDENDPFSKLENIKYYQELKEELKSGYFERIITDYILNNGKQKG